MSILQTFPSVIGLPAFDRLIAASCLSYKSDSVAIVRPCASPIFECMQPYPGRRKWQRRTHYGVPKFLGGIGVAIVIVFLLWTMAMVFMQAWQATQTHAK